MTRALEVAALAGVALAVATVALRDPGEPYAVPMLAAALGLAAGAGSARLLLGRAPAGRALRARAGRARALRRGTWAGAAVAILIALRAVDGLTLLTAIFVVLAFGLAEVALTARTPAVR